MPARASRPAKITPSVPVNTCVEDNIKVSPGAELSLSSFNPNFSATAACFQAKHDQSASDVHSHSPPIIPQLNPTVQLRSKERKTTIAWRNWNLGKYGCGRCTTTRPRRTVICRSAQAISSLLTGALSRGTAGYRASAMGGLEFSPRITPSRGDVCISVCRLLWGKWGVGASLLLFSFPSHVDARHQTVRWFSSRESVRLCAPCHIFLSFLILT